MIWRSDSHLFPLLARPPFSIDRWSGVCSTLNLIDSVNEELRWLENVGCAFHAQGTWYVPWVASYKVCTYFFLHSHFVDR